MVSFQRARSRIALFAHRWVLYRRAHRVGSKVKQTRYFSEHKHKCFTFVLSPRTRCFSISVNEYVCAWHGMALAYTEFRFAVLHPTYSIWDYLFVFMFVYVIFSRSLFRLISFGCCHCNVKQANAMIVVTNNNSNIKHNHDGRQRHRWTNKKNNGNNIIVSTAWAAHTLLLLSCMHIC